MKRSELEGYLAVAREVRPLDSQDTTIARYLWGLREDAADAIEALVEEVKRVAALYQDEYRLRRQLEVDVRNLLEGYLTVARELEIERFNVMQRDRISSGD